MPERKTSFFACLTATSSEDDGLNIDEIQWSPSWEGITKVLQEEHQDEWLNEPEPSNFGGYDLQVEDEEGSFVTSTLNIFHVAAGTTEVWLAGYVALTSSDYSGPYIGEIRMFMTGEEAREHSRKRLVENADLDAGHEDTTELHGAGMNAMARFDIEVEDEPGEFTFYYSNHGNSYVVTIKRIVLQSEAASLDRTT